MAILIILSPFVNKNDYHYRLVEVAGVEPASVARHKSFSTSVASCSYVSGQH